MTIKIGDNLDFQSSSRIINLPASSNPGDPVNKTELNNAIASLSGISVKVPSALDCSANPNYPASSAGDSYQVTVAGKIGGASGVNVNVGDIIYCRVTSVAGDEATVGTNFYIVEANRDAASESISGFISIATQTEVNTGTLDTKAVTPAKLQSKINSSLSALKTSAVVGNGSNSTFTITHGLNDPNVIVQIRETVSGQMVWAGVTNVDNNNVQITFTNPPTTNQYTVSIR